VKTKKTLVQPNRDYEFNKNPQKSYKNIYVRFLKIFVFYFFK
jgi:hypothetical protein